MDILNTICSPEDVKALPKDQLPALCTEIRDFLIRSLSSTGGHLSSNLGIVELTVAIHRVYDTTKDRLVFDVGHQCYVHKLLTGRRDDFGSLRRFGGISGFPKPCESEHDAFIAGHASNAVSVALGMARARRELGGNYDVVALLGDGALTGGLAYEGLSDAGESGEPIVVILNDNGMSINPNVGGIARLLRRARVRPCYLDFKRRYRRLFARWPELYSFNHNAKEKLKDRLLGNNMFEDMGFYYLGPIDGHNCAAVETALRLAREMRIPVLLHVLTEKGHGCSFAQARPNTYHGVGSFDPVTGAMPKAEPDFSGVFGETLSALAREDSRICAVTAAMESGTGLESFAMGFPDRFFDVGIAEGHAVAMAAGMAKQGAVPVFAVYSSFLQRAYDMLIHDVSLQRLHVVFCVDRAGLVGRDGETHHGLFDVNYLSSVPGMTVLCPASFAEMREMLRIGIKEIDGPVAIRYPRGGEGNYSDNHARKGCVTLRAGSDLTIATYGTMICEALAAADILEKEGISAEVLKLSTICPLDAEPVLASAAKTGRLLVPEEVCAAGCVGKQLGYAAAQKGLKLGLQLLNLGNGIVQQGSVEELRHSYGIDALAIADAAKALTGGAK